MSQVGRGIGGPGGGRCLGRNSPPPRIFWASEGSSEPCSHGADFSKLTLRSVSFISLGKLRFTCFSRFGAGFVGWGPVLPVRDPTDKKVSAPEKSKKNLEFFFCCGFKKCVFVGAILLRFWPLVHPIGAVRTEKTYSFPGQKKSRPEKVEFFILHCGVEKSVFGPWCLPLFLIGVTVRPVQSRTKNTEFSGAQTSQRKSQRGLPLFLIRVTELKYVAGLPNY